MSSIVEIDTIGKFKYTTNSEGQYHSYDDVPAIEYLDGSNLKIWMVNGVLHRNSSKAAIIYPKNTTNPNTTISEFYVLGELILQFENNQYLYKGETPKWLAIIYWRDNEWIYEKLVILHNNYYYAVNFENKTVKGIFDYTINKILVIDDSTSNTTLFDITNNKIVDEPFYTTLYGDIYIKSKFEKIDMDKYSSATCNNNVGNIPVIKKKSKLKKNKLL
jgi:hypothetical protein